MITYRHSFANYPKSFKGFVVSPHKICLQWSTVQTKLRIAYRDDSDLLKLPTTERALPVVPNGVGIDTLAVGCEMPIIEELQDQLIKAYAEYWEKHSEYYSNKYGKGFSLFLLNTIKKLEGILCGQQY